MLQENIVEAIKSVNESLKTYEAEWISLKRSPYADKERIHSLRQFIECRLNMEFFYIPELREYVENFDGHFLEVMSVIGEDSRRRRFEYVIAYINKNPDWYMGEDFCNDMIKIENLIGGSKIKFTYSPKRPKITIEK